MFFRRRIVPLCVLLAVLSGCRFGSDSALKSISESKPIVGMGTEHLCALKDGKVRCWHNSPKEIAVVPDLPYVKKLAVGPKTNCVITDNGIQCWGATKDDKGLPVPPMDHPNDVMVGNDFACALADGEVSCWWQNSKNELVVRKVDGFTSPTRIFLAYDDETYPYKPGMLPTRRGRTHPCIVEGTKVTCLVLSNNIDGDRLHKFISRPSYSLTAPQMECGIEFGRGIKGCHLNSYKFMIDARAGLSQVVNDGVFHCEIFGSQAHCWKGVSTMGSNNFSVYGFREVAVPPMKAPTSIGVNPSFACAIDTDRVVCWDEEKEIPSPFTERPLELVSDANKICAVYDGRIDCVGILAGAQAHFWKSDKLEDLTIGRTHQCATDGKDIRCWGRGRYDFEKSILITPKIGNPKLLRSDMDRSCVIHDGGLNCWGTSLYAGYPVEWGNPLRFYDFYRICPFFSNVGMRCQHWIDGGWEEPREMSGLPSGNIKSDQVVTENDFMCVLTTGVLDCYKYYHNNVFDNSTRIPVPVVGKVKQIVAQYYSRLNVIDEEGLKVFRLGAELRADLQFKKSIPDDSILSSGGEHICYSSQSTNEVECWDDHRFPSPYKVGQLDAPALKSPRKIQAGGLWGDRSSCAIDAEGFKCWGEVFSERTYSL